MKTTEELNLDKEHLLRKRGCLSSACCRSQVMVLFAPTTRIRKAGKLTKHLLQPHCASSSRSLDASYMHHRSRLIHRTWICQGRVRHSEQTYVGHALRFLLCRFPHTVLMALSAQQCCTHQCGQILKFQISCEPWRGGPDMPCSLQRTTADKCSRSQPCCGCNFPASQSSSAE